MGQINSGCDCGNDEGKINVESYIEPPIITKEDVHQIWKCFEYLNPSNGVVFREALLRNKSSTPIYMNEIIDTMHHEAKNNISERARKQRLSVNGKPLNKCVLPNLSL